MIVSVGVVTLTCLWGALAALAALFTAAVEREALEHFDAHGR